VSAEREHDSNSKTDAQNLSCRYDFSKMVAPGEPGYKWTVDIGQYENTPNFHVHTSDMLRLLLLYTHGGSYLDMDHITTGAILGAKGPGYNLFGGEECRNDNPDCMDAQGLLRLNVINAEVRRVIAASETIHVKGRRGVASIIVLTLSKTSTISSFG
jgi:hypothetical protein